MATRPVEPTSGLGLARLTHLLLNSCDPDRTRTGDARLDKAVL